MCINGRIELYPIHPAHPAKYAVQLAVLRADEIFATRHIETLFQTSYAFLRLKLVGNRIQFHAHLEIPHG